MSNSKHRYRRGARRLTSVIAASAVVGTGAIAATGIAYAEETTPAVTLETFDASDFAAQAAELPGSLKNAIERDLKISPAEYLANAEAAKVAGEVAASLRADGVGINGVSIDGQDVTIYVAAEADVEAVLSVGAKVEVGEPEQPDRSGQEFEPKEDLRGGYGYISYLDGEAFSRCSVGFTGYDNGGDFRLLTAGHCGWDFADTGEDLDRVQHINAEEPLGRDGGIPAEWWGDDIGMHTPGSNHFGPNVHHDGGLIDVTEAGWDNVPQVSEWGGGAGNPADGAVTIYGHVDPVEGAPACKSGATTGWTCGTILTEEETFFYGPEDDPQAHVTGFTMDACIFGGDSGGSIVSGPYAVGVNSGGSVVPDEWGCAEWNDYNEGAPDNEKAITIGYALSSGDYHAFDLYGNDFELNVEVNTPEITSATGDESGAVIRGEVENATASHALTVAIEELGEFEPELNSDGEFVIEVEEELEVGATYGYTAQAFYGNFSQSGVAEGSFTIEEGEPEPDVEELVVTSPTDGQTTSNARPPFEGTGEPGADVSLSVGGEDFGSATVTDEGDWEITPESDLPRGERFDATVTQVAGEDVQEVTVQDLGIRLPSVSITVPEEGAEVGGGVVFEGTSFPDAEIGLLLEGEAAADEDAADAPAFGAMTDDVAPAQDEDVEVWEGEFEIDEDGNWRFTPDEPLADGEYTITAFATVEGGDPELTDSEDSVSFTVVTRDDDGDDDGDDDEDLPDTGSGNLLFILIGVGLLAAGGGALALRARRNASNA